MRNLYRLCALLGMIAVAPVVAGGVTWIAQNPADDMSVPGNWSTDVVPTTLDDAIFDSSIPNVNLNPVESTTGFTVSTIQFPGSASAFTLHFDNQSLTLTGSGITGANTNTTIDATNIDNSSFIGNQITFAGLSASSGSAIVNIINSGTLTGITGTLSVSIASINSNLHSTGTTGIFTIGNDARITASNTGNDSTIGTGNNGTANTGVSQLQFDQSFTAGDNVSVSVLNSGTFSGTNSVQGDAVSIVNGSQFISSGVFHVGDNFNCELQNTGNDSSHGVGLSNVGQLNAAQMILQTTGTVGNNCRITISNTGVNSSQTTDFPDFIGYLNNQQFFVGNIFQAGDGFSLTTSNTGTDTSNGYGGYQVAIINSNSGTTGNQILFQQGCRLGDHATISATNSGTYSGANTNGGSNVAGMNLQQIAIGDSTLPGLYSFNAGDYFSLSASSSGIDRGNGIGGDSVGNTSTDQITFFTPVSLVNQANITITNSGNFSGNASTTYVNVGSAGGSQLNCVSSFSADDDFTLSVSNSGANTGTGVGGYFIGDLIVGQQVTFQNSLIIGNNASITISNSGSNSSNTTFNNQVGSLMGYGKQLLAKNLFRVGDDFSLKITNSGFDDSTGSGGNFVGFINNNTVDTSASQFHLANGCTIGDRASITLSNTGTYQGNNTASGNLVCVLAGQQLYSVQDFHVGNDFGLTVSNSGVDNASGQNNNSIGTVGSSQVEFGDACVLGNNASISLSNSGTNHDTTGTFNSIGVINGSQFSVTGTFFAGSYLNLSATNSSVHTGDLSKLVGVIGEYQIAFNDSVTVGDGSVISAYNSNSGTISNIGNGTHSQILFSQGFTINGKATIQAINEGVIEGSGIQILGNNSGGDAKIVLGNSLLNINTSGPTFTIGELNGDVTSLAQSYPQLIINTDPSVNATFSGTIQDYSGTISSSSSLVKTGAGTQILAGINTYTGLTTIQQGTLAVNGSVAGDVNISPLGILKGTGTIGGDVTNTGVIAPGQSIGTLHINGDLINNGGNYDLEIDGSGNSDLIVVGGTAAINGGIVLVSSPDNTYALYQPYTILSAGAITGSLYTDAVPLSALVNPVLSYDDTHVYVTLEADISRAADTHNQLAVADRLDGITSPNANQLLLLNQMVGLSVDEARSALDTLSGYQHTEDFWLAQTIGRQFIRRLYDPLRPIISTDRNECCNACDDCNDPEWSIWLESGGDFSELKGNKNAKGLSMNGYEITAGVQGTGCCDAIFGLAGSYESSHVHYYHGGSGKNNTGLVGVYGLYRPERFYGLIDLSYGYSSNKINRAIVVGTLDYTAHSKPKISQGNVYGEIGVDFHPGCIFMQVFGGIEAGRYWRNSVRESESHGWGLSIRKKNLSVVNSRLGIHMNANDLFCNSNLSLDVAWNKLLSSRRNSIDGRFIQFGDSYTIEGIDFNNNSVDYALTLSSEFCTSWRGYLEFAGEYWDNLVTSNVLVGVEFSW